MSLSLNEILDIAKNSKDLSSLKPLLNTKSMIVRRALARNEHIDESMANILAFDPVLNVSYMATKNPNCTKIRDFSQYKLSNCVLCEKDERELDCTNCENKKIFR
ncbi:hypothetical protein CRU99_04850 [Malaciobacter mytili]|uniref:Uncharacterized protein n=1 Tax=Malaciobacter mytili LMG 24559 TaxID=1032238 RepID=A0AAX2ADC5_9BACT|nr:hypothetical protein [Malaciobacter mytili]AXH13638.1 hypothetical protein AMYT_0010 [Malaciobacter mytili LMG 24559]RXI44677.1 hypothetical protein CRU99_04850 [Malaciobacter mytili]RXK13822.1 hypothetical protein CP985_12810 [Malaciobacter mytili LMG 24559]